MLEKRKLGYIKKIAEGKYFIRVSMGFDEFGKRLQLSKTIDCASEREAEKELALLYAQRNQLAGERRTGAPKTLAALYKEWSEAHVSALEENSKSFYASLWENHVKEYGGLKLSALSPATCKKIIGDDKSRTTEAVYKMLKAMCGKAVKWGFLEKNFFEFIDPPKYVPGEKLIFDDNQLRAVTHFIKFEQLKYQIAFYFATVCGMRRQEIVALKWEDIDFASGSFRICRAAVSVKGQGTVIKDTKSTSSRRRLHLPEFLERLLLRHQIDQLELREKMGTKWHDDGFVLTQYDGQIMNVTTPSHWWADFLDAHRCLPHVTFHGLRHTMASHALKDGAALTVVSAILGHAQTSTTANIYAHALEGWDTGAIDRMCAKVCNEVCNNPRGTFFEENEKNAVTLAGTAFFRGDPSGIRTPDTLIKRQNKL